MVDVKTLIPQEKRDMTKAKAAIAAGYPVVAPILRDLLIWLQDINWPVARVLAPFLASIGAPLAPFIQDILNTEDQIWKYWVILVVLGESRELAEALRANLRRLARTPNEAEAMASLDEVASSVLAKFGWTD